MWGGESMELDLVLETIDQNGYIGLFLWLWIGVFGMPVPNELIAMTVGLAASLGKMHPVLAFLVTYCGIVAALTTSYTVGKYIGGPLLPLFRKSKRMSRTIDRSFYVIDKHHAFSLLFSYFIPGLRNFVPFLYGLSRFSYRSFAFYAYSGALGWLVIVFSLGFWFGDHKETIIRYETEFFSMLIVVAILFILVKMFYRKKVKNFGRHEA